MARPLDQAAVERILAAVGHNRVPPDLDRGELLNDLLGIGSLYVTGVDLRAKPAKRQQRAARIVAAAENLKALIREHDDTGGLQYVGHRKAIDRIISEFEKELPPQLVEVLGLNTTSALNQLVGLHLRKTYELHFRTEAGYSQDGENVTGPFIDFAEAVMKESGMFYERRSISDALRKYKATNRQNSVETR